MSIRTEIVAHTYEARRYARLSEYAKAAYAINVTFQIS